MANPNSRICFTSRDMSPCYGCPDRYPACSGHCKKPEYIEWCEKRDLVKKNRKAYEKEVNDQIEITRKRFNRK
jgi:hypothetical protein